MSGARRLLFGCSIGSFKLVYGLEKESMDTLCFRLQFVCENNNIFHYNSKMMVLFFAVTTTGLTTYKSYGTWRNGAMDDISV